MKRLLFLCGFLVFVSQAFAVQPDEVLNNPVLETRARDISSQLRCLVCQNESIDDSGAPFARDLRLLVRERLQVGDSNKQVIAFIVERYGNYVLLKPPFKGSGIILWLLPFTVLILAIIVLLALFLRNHKRAAQPLNAEEEKALQHILNKAAKKDKA